MAIWHGVLLLRGEADPFYSCRTWFPDEGAAYLPRAPSRPASGPVWRNPDTGSWTIYRYDDVAAILSDARTFSSSFGEMVPDHRDELLEGNIVAMDPPRHDQLRSLVSQAFTPRAIAQLEARIGELTEELLNQTHGATQIELVADLAHPLPVTVIAELLGVPAADRALFKEWADALLDQGNRDLRNESAIAAARAQVRHFHDYLREHVGQRRARPRSDLLSNLVAAEIDGERLSDDEIVGFATILLIAGHITTTLLLGNTILSLDEHPAAQNALRTNPTAIPTAIEEALRFRSPVPMTARVTTTEVQLADQRISPKQLIYPSLLSANHDERRFDRPDDFLIDRHPNPHLAFGKGIHFCLGAPPARLESRIVLGILLRRFASIRVDPAQPLQTYSFFNGPRELHLQVK
jgi:cytochrome P450